MIDPARSIGKREFAVALGGSLAITAVFLPIALWLGREYVPDVRPTGAVVALLTKFEPDGGFAFSAPTQMLGEHIDDDPRNQRSPVVVYEGATPLKFPRSARADIQNIGLGRFNFVRQSHDTVTTYVVFSTSDNSDPRTNGRNYWLVLPAASTH
ncbi:hypothetical protein [Bradyrhizobium sp. ORS 86]|uniref:hypothetical protein n=1 Tax=Bradyrhizobium sp. ORS 86 TaxID=1685970 RepID=UPI00388EBB06